MNLLDLMVKIGVDDQASGRIDSITTGIIAKGNIIANAVTGAFGAIGNLASAVVGFGQSAIGAYAQYEQLVGGVDTLYKNASGQLQKYAADAFKTANMSANQYMELATGFAAALVQSSSSGMADAASQGTQALQSAFDDQYSMAEKAYSDQYKALQRAFSAEEKAYSRHLSKELSEIQKMYSRELSELQKTNEKRLSELQKANEREVSDFQKLTDTRIKEMERARDAALRVLQEEQDARTKSIDDQIKALEEQGNADEKAAKEAERAEKRAELQKRLLYSETASQRREAQQEISKLEESIAKQERDEARKRQIEKLKNQKQAIKDEVSQRKDAAKDRYSADVEAYKESRAEQLEALREANKAEESALRESQQAQVEALRESQQAQVEAMREANEDALDAMRTAHQDQLEATRESQQAQLKALQDSISQQQQMMSDGMSSAGEFAEASAEDYERAAKLADMAIRDMADNANKMGSAMESLQNAYNVFAKGNFMMLDYLKLGFGGTKTEMERLLQMAEQIKAANGETVDYSIDKFGDIVEAIHTVQQEYEISGYSVEELQGKLKDASLTEQELMRVAQDLGISYEEASEKMRSGALSAQEAIILTGTTSYEASSTVQGSLNTMQASWENFLVALTNPDTDLGEATEQLMDSLLVAAENLIPRLGILIDRAGIWLREHAPDAIQQFVDGAKEFLREHFNIGEEDLAGFMHGFQTVLEGLTGFVGFLMDVGAAFNNGKQAVESFLKPFDEHLGPAIEYITEQWDKLTKSIGDGEDATDSSNSGINRWIEAAGRVLMLILGSVINIIGTVIEIVNAAIDTFNSWKSTVEDVINGIRDFVNTAQEKFGEFKDVVDQKIEDVIGFFRDLPENIVNALGDLGSTLWNAGGDLIQGLIDGIMGAPASIGNALIDTVGNGIDNLKGFLGIASPSKLFKKLGNYTMEGMALGIEEDADSAVKAMHSAAERVYGAADGTATIGVNAAPMAAGGFSVYVNIGEFANYSDRDARTLAQMIGSYTASEMRARGIA